MSNNASGRERPSAAQPPDPQENLKRRIHEVIFEADTVAGVVFDVLLLLVIVASIVVVALETVPGVGAPKADGSPGRLTTQLRILSWVFTGLFTLEYLLRLYCVRKPSRR